jgi:hypothetical protein
MWSAIFGHCDAATSHELLVELISITPSRISLLEEQRSLE